MNFYLLPPPPPPWCSELLQNQFFEGACSQQSSELIPSLSASLPLLIPGREKERRNIALSERFRAARRHPPRTYMLLPKRSR